MSVPRCVCASKISAPSGSSRRSSSSHCAISFWASCSGSSTPWSVCSSPPASRTRAWRRIAVVADILIYGDSIRTPELRHEVPVPIPDPFLYAEKGGRRVAVLHSLEIPRVREDAPQLEIVPLESLGTDELYGQGLEGWQIELEVAVRGCRELGIERAVVPSSFPVGHAD